MSDAGSVVEVNGPLVKVRLPHVRTGEQVSIGSLALTGEVLGRKGDEAIVQVYESTETVRPGDDVVPLGHPLSVELGPGLLGRIFDGVQRPLDEISRLHGDTIPRGISVTSLDREAVWHFTPRPGLTVGEQLSEGFSLGEVPETESIVHHILVPPGINGKLVELAPAGEYRVEDTIAVLHGAEGREHRLQLFHRWPVRVPRPHVRRIHTAEPLLSGQRIIDLFFPVLKGGKAAIPGPFGAGKTILQHQIARWSNADIVIYVGCGERGNELVDILNSFPALKDPYSGRSLMERTLLVANTSNMPVVAREASIYVGVTLAEYYRDQGYHVVMVADSTSRWAEALREVAGRLGQMPVEEGYPANLASRLAAFYERAGRVESLGGEFGSVTLIGAVSPPGGDFSGDYFTITDAWCEPKPVQDRLPILVGTGSPRMLGITARHADEWNTWGAPDLAAGRRADFERARSESITAWDRVHEVEKEAEEVAAHLVGRPLRPPPARAERPGCGRRPRPRHLGVGPGTPSGARGQSRAGRSSWRQHRRHRCTGRRHLRRCL